MNITTPTPVKICGLTRLQDARLAWELGAAALGFIFHAKSPRSLAPDQAAEIRRQLPQEAFCVGVFVNWSAEAMNRVADDVGLDALQLHGRETPATCAACRRPVIKVIRAEDTDQLDTYPAAAFLLDAAHPTLLGGTGLRADWELARNLACRVPLILAGGLTPANIREAEASVHPLGLDVASGVEAAPGIKDPALLTELMNCMQSHGERPCLIPR